MYKYLKNIKRVDSNFFNQSKIKFIKNQNLNTSFKKYSTFNSLKKNILVLKFYFLIINKIKNKKYFILSFVFFENFYKKFKQDFIKDKKLIFKIIEINDSISIILNFLFILLFNILFTFLRNSKTKIIFLKFFVNQRLFGIKHRAFSSFALVRSFDIADCVFGKAEEEPSLLQLLPSHSFTSVLLHRLRQSNSAEPRKQFGGAEEANQEQRSEFGIRDSKTANCIKTIIYNSNKRFPNENKIIINDFSSFVIKDFKKTEKSNKRLSILEFFKRNSIEFIFINFFSIVLHFESSIQQLPSLSFLLLNSCINSFVSLEPILNVDSAKAKGSKKIKAEAHFQFAFSAKPNCFGSSASQPLRGSKQLTNQRANAKAELMRLQSGFEGVHKNKNTNHIFFIKKIKNCKINENKKTYLKFFCLKKKELFYFMFFLASAPSSLPSLHEKRNIYYYINLLFHFYCFSLKKIQHIILIKTFLIQNSSKKKTQFLCSNSFMHKALSVPHRMLLEPSKKETQHSTSPPMSDFASLLHQCSMGDTLCISERKKTYKFFNKFSLNNNMFFLFNNKNFLNNMIFEIYNKVLFLNNYFSIFINQKYKPFRMHNLIKSKTLKNFKLTQNIYNIKLLLKFQKIFYCIEMTYFLSKKNFYNKTKKFLFFKIQKLLSNCFIFKKKSFLPLYSIIFSKKKYSDFYYHFNDNILEKESVLSIFIKKKLLFFHSQSKSKEKAPLHVSLNYPKQSNEPKCSKRGGSMQKEAKEKKQTKGSKRIDKSKISSLLHKRQQKNEYKAINMVLNNVKKSNRKIEIILGPLKFGLSFELYCNILSFYTFNYFIKQSIKTIKSNFLFYDCLNFYKKKFFNLNNYSCSSFSMLLKTTKIKDLNKTKKKQRKNETLKKILIKKSIIYTLLSKKQNLVINNQNFFYVLKKLIEILKQIRPLKYLLHLKRYFFVTAQSKNLKNFTFFNIILKAFYPYYKMSNFVLNSFDIENYLKSKILFLIIKFTKINMSFLKKNSISFFLSELKIQNNFLAILLYTLLFQYTNEPTQTNSIISNDDRSKDINQKIFNSYNKKGTYLPNSDSSCFFTTQGAYRNQSIKHWLFHFSAFSHAIGQAEAEQFGFAEQQLLQSKPTKRSECINTSEKKEKNEYIRLYNLGFYYGSFFFNFNINIFDIVDILYKNFYISFLKIEKPKLFKIRLIKSSIRKNKYSYKTYKINFFKYKFFKSVLKKLFSLLHFGDSSLSERIGSVLRLRQTRDQTDESNRTDANTNKKIKKKKYIKSIFSLHTKYKKSLKNNNLFLYDFKKFFFNNSFFTIYKNYQINKIQNKNKFFLIKKWDPLKGRYQKKSNYIWKKNKISVFYETNYLNIFYNSKFSNYLITDKNNIFILNSKYTIINKFANATIAWNTEYNISHCSVLQKKINKNKENIFYLKKRKILSLEEMHSLKKNGLNFKGFFLFLRYVSNTLSDSKKERLNTKEFLIRDKKGCLIKKQISILKNHKVQNFHQFFFYFVLGHEAKKIASILLRSARSRQAKKPSFHFSDSSASPTAQAHRTNAKEQQSTSKQNKCMHFCFTSLESSNCQSSIDKPKMQQTIQYFNFALASAVQSRVRLRRSTEPKRRQSQCKINTGLIPSKINLKKHLNLLKNIILKNNSQAQKKLLYKLSYRIMNWSYYYKIVTNSQLFYYCDKIIYKLLWKWACRNHPNKSKKWIQQKYFFSLKNKKWVFGILPKNFDSKSSRKDIFYLPFHNFLIKI
uniref:Group II intron maturase-specific domain-containing protein n=1 Tax=Pediastrum duplex TaxID=3105 RepID=A0A2U8GJC5_PEDDU|nr:hypothetical protein [Pediastrum duplex]